MLYCIEVDRSGIVEENMVIHQQFINKPSREDVLKFLLEQDIGYDDRYCSFEYHRVG